MRRILEDVGAGGAADPKRCSAGDAAGTHGAHGAGRAGDAAAAAVQVVSVQVDAAAAAVTLICQAAHHAASPLARGACLTRRPAVTAVGVVRLGVDAASVTELLLGGAGGDTLASGAAFSLITAGVAAAAMVRVPRGVHTGCTAAIRVRAPGFTGAALQPADTGHADQTHVTQTVTPAAMRAVRCRCHTHPVTRGLPRDTGQCAGAGHTLQSGWTCRSARAAVRPVRLHIHAGISAGQVRSTPRLPGCGLGGAAGEKHNQGRAEQDDEVCHAHRKAQPAAFVRTDCRSAEAGWWQW